MQLFDPRAIISSSTWGTINSNLFISNIFPGDKFIPF